jgi:excisionase family DNA binding protein
MDNPLEFFQKELERHQEDNRDKLERLRQLPKMSREMAMPVIDDLTETCVTYVAARRRVAREKMAHKKATVAATSKLSKSEKWYTPDDLVKITGFHYETITGWMREGKIPATKVGRRWKMTPEQFEEWLQKPP